MKPLRLSFNCSLYGGSASAQSTLDRPRESKTATAMDRASSQCLMNQLQNYLLAEIIKQHSPSPSVLMSVVYNLGIQTPNWNEIALPPGQFLFSLMLGKLPMIPQHFARSIKLRPHILGRSLNSCQAAYNDLRRTPLSMLPGTIGPQTPSPLSAHPLGKRPYPFEGSASFPTGREIRPKPTSSAGTYGQPSPIENTSKKKRGRPTKLDVQKRAEKQAGGGEAGPAPRPQPAEAISAGPQAQPASLVEPALPGQATVEETRLLPPVSRMPIASILTPTAPQSTSQSSSSSGKRRRGRSTRSEPEDIPSAGTSGARQRPEYESPYATVIELQDSPARAAVLRHREEPDTRSPYAGPHYSGAQAPPTTTSPDLGTI